MRLIDADALYEQAADTAEHYCGFFNDMEKVISARDIEQAPSIFLLKPCPFCGGKASLFVENGVRVLCQKCRAQTSPLKDMISDSGVWGNATEAVITAWNRRADNG